MLIIKDKAAERDDTKPVSVALHAQEVGKLYAVKTTPFEYMQGLLYRFRQAGAPVEGEAILKLAHGQIFKMRSHPWGKDWVGYLWLPAEKVAELDRWRQANGLKSLERLVQ